MISCQKEPALLINLIKDGDKIVLGVSGGPDSDGAADRAGVAGGRGWTGLCYTDDVYAVWHQYSPASGEGPPDREPAGGRSEEHSGRSRRARAHDTGEDSEVHPVCGDGRRGAVLDRVADTVEEEG